jgi:hypothetical protein
MSLKFHWFSLKFHWFLPTSGDGRIIRARGDSGGWPEGRRDRVATARA